MIVTPYKVYSCLSPLPFSLILSPYPSELSPIDKAGTFLRVKHYVFVRASLELQQSIAYKSLKLIIRIEPYTLVSTCRFFNQLK